MDNNFLYNTFRLADNSIRPGETPTDALMSVHKATGDQASVKVKTAYKPGSKVAYLPFKIVEVDANGEIDVVTTGITGTAYVVALGKVMNLYQDGDCL